MPEETVLCPNCEENILDYGEVEPMYACGNCGTEFTRGNSEDGMSHQCPDCKLYAGRAGNACPSCEEPLEDEETLDKLKEEKIGGLDW